MDNTGSAMEELIRRQRRELSAIDTDARRDLIRRYAQTISRIEDELAKLAERLSAGPLPDSWFDERGRFTPTGELMFRQQYLEAMLRQVQNEYAVAASDYRLMLATAQEQAAGLAQRHAVEQLGAVGIPFVPRLNVPAVERFLALSQPGSPLADVLNSFGAEAADVIESEIFTGMASGIGPREIVDNIVRQIGTEVATSRLSAIVRTETMRAYRGSLIEQYENPDIEARIIGYRWMATRSERTCVACLARHGKVYPKDKFPRDHHVNCRCTVSPVPIRQFGPPVETGEQWLREQPRSVQRTILGADDAVDAFRAGIIHLDDFAESVPAGPWGYSLRRKSWRQVQRTHPALRTDLPDIPRRPDEPEWSYLARRRIAAGLSSEEDLRELGSILAPEINRRIGPASDDYYLVVSEYRARRNTLLDDDGAKRAFADLVARQSQAGIEFSHAINDAVSEVIGTIRPLGATGRLRLKLPADPLVARDVQSALRRALDVFPTDWSDALIDFSRANPIQADIVPRGYWFEVGPQIMLSGHGPFRLQSTATHELVHAFEHINPQIPRLEGQFWRRRTAGEDPITGYGYRPDERFVPDSFLDIYMGKTYEVPGAPPDQYWELATMGFQYLLGPDAGELFDVRADVEYFQFLLGLLAGI